MDSFSIYTLFFFKYTLGTFLVRSGILTSVHSFASDASRGLFILLIFFLTTGFGFLVFLIKNPSRKKSFKFAFDKQNFCTNN